MHTDDLNEDDLEAIAAGYPGTVTYFAADLQTGRTWERAADFPMRSASIIKTPIMVEAFAQVAAGRREWTLPVRLDRTQAVGGSGVLQYLSDGVTLPLRDLVTLMIVLSDNTATNLVLDALAGGPGAVNTHMRALGLPLTTVFRKSFSPDDPTDPDGVKFGLGRTTARETVALLTGIARGEVVSPQASAEMQTILAQQTDRDGIARYLPEGTSFAGKSGRLSPLRNDSGLVSFDEGRGPLALAIFCDGQPASDTGRPEDIGLLTIARLAEALVSDPGA